VLVCMVVCVSVWLWMCGCVVCVCVSVCVCVCVWVGGWMGGWHIFADHTIEFFSSLVMLVHSRTCNILKHMICPKG